LRHPAIIAALNSRVPRARPVRRGTTLRPALHRLHGRSDRPSTPKPARRSAPRHERSSSRVAFASAVVRRSPALPASPLRVGWRPFGGASLCSCLQRKRHPEAQRPGTRPAARHGGRTEHTQQGRQSPVSEAQPALLRQKSEASRHSRHYRRSMLVRYAASGGPGEGLGSIAGHIRRSLADAYASRPLNQSAASSSTS
jgi:hypothetical protein